jgi:putative heme-binding domain-containing protein
MQPARHLLGIFFATIAFASLAAQDNQPLSLQIRQRTKAASGSDYEVKQNTVQWNPRKTAIIICDMWDQHWCKGASERVAEMAPAMNATVRAARDRGVFIIHAPSETMDFYKNTPQRRRALEAPTAKAPMEIGRWTRIDPAKEGAFPVDDSDGGCDDLPRCKGGPPYPWKRQISTIEIGADDAVTDSGQEVYNLLQQRGIDNVLVMGVHANMCVLGRSFAIRQLVRLGKNVLLVRDLTDTMYCSRSRPFVNHFRGTDLVIEHIEKFWCPSTTSASLTAKPAFHFQADNRAGVSAAAAINEALRPSDSPTPNKSSDLERAGNDAVREHIRKFTARGQLSESGIKPLTPEESVKAALMADGLELHLAASEPAVRQPVSISFDEHGRMWVVQYLQYPFPAGLKIIKYDEHLRAVFDKVPAAPPNHVPGADKVTILEDKDGDGYYETHKDFVTGLNIATSVLPDRDGAWVMNPPYLLFYPDKNHDDIPDGAPEVHLSGFGLEDTHAVANSLTWGPDGWIYGAQGSTCTATVKGIHFLGQAIWRYHPPTRRFELFAEGGGNTFCVEFDAKGRVYSGTNWGDERGLYYVPGGYYVKGWGKHGPLTNPNAFGFFNHMQHSGDKARFSHAFVIYEGGALPEKYFGKLFGAVPLQNRVQVAELIPDGSTFKTHDLDRAVQSNDRWFRPVDIKAGPDGAIYLADWYDIRLTHVDPRDTWDRSNGRIYRVTAKGAAAAKAQDLGRFSNAQLVGALGSTNKWIRQTARRLIAERNDQSLLPGLKRLVENGDAQTALEALWAVYRLGGFDDAFALKQLSHSDPFVRLWTVRLLTDEIGKSLSSSLRDRVVELAKYDPSAHVRSQLASSAKRLPADQAIPVIEQLLQHDSDAADPHIPLLIWWAIENKSISRLKDWVALFSKRDEWSYRIAAEYIAPRLVQRCAAENNIQTLDAAAALMRIAPRDQRERLVAALAEGFKGRKIESGSAALRSELASIDGKSKPELMTLKIRLRAATDEERQLAYKLVRDDEDKLKTQRIDLITALGEGTDKASLSSLTDTIASSRWHSVRKAALNALQEFDDDQLGQLILQNYSKLPKDQGVRPTAIDVLSRRKSWSLALLKAVETKTVDRADVPIDVLERMKLYREPAIDRSIAKNWGSLRQPTQQLRDRMAQVQKIATSGSGDPTRGKGLFGATCATCHKLYGEGQTIGPDLTGYERDNLDFLLISIIDPSAAIREEYTNFELETNDGLLLTGFVVERGAQSVTIEDGQGGRTMIPQSRIKRLQASATSRMPEGLLDSFNDQQIRDLFAYLRSRSS